MASLDELFNKTEESVRKWAEEQKDTELSYLREQVNRHEQKNEDILNFLKRKHGEYFQDAVDAQTPVQEGVIKALANLFLYVHDSIVTEDFDPPVSVKGKEVTR